MVATSIPAPPFDSESVTILLQPASRQPARIIHRQFSRSVPFAHSIMSASEARLTSMAKPAIQYLLRRDDELSDRVASRNTSPVLGYLATAGRALPVGD